MLQKKRLIIEWLNSQSHMQMDDYTLRLLNHLLKDEKDIETFWTKCAPNAMSTQAIVDMFWVTQREIKRLTKVEFEEWCRINLKAALEYQFQEPLTDEDVEMLIKADKPLGEVYQLSVEHPNLPLHILLERWDFVKIGSKISSFRDGLDTWFK
ncbi:hypothetical protein GCM10008931_42690 [Oceanobacillus oncorhynchi subsp. oncorhynchi]|uniref:hypothetical protein n=1 Tax=Oceanobacillus oncorhynchi TaxID=545501 RepID=UPI0031E1CE69